jgi:subtilisin family serine protease
VEITLLSQYDRARGDWDFRRTGRFWEAVEEGKRRGLTGQGKRVAVIDSAFDLSFPTITGASAGTLRKRAPLGEPTEHGTAVALLILSVAPGVTLDLYEVTRDGVPDLFAVRTALEAAVKSGVDAICLSLGIPVDRASVSIDFDPTRFLKQGEIAIERKISVNPCPVPKCLCQELNRFISNGPMMFAAVGNNEEQFFAPLFLRMQ